MIPYPPYVPPSPLLPVSALPRRRDSLPSPPPTPVSSTPLGGFGVAVEAAPAAPSPPPTSPSSPSSPPPASTSPIIASDATHESQPVPSFKPPAHYLNRPSRSFPSFPANTFPSANDPPRAGFTHAAVQTDTHARPNARLSTSFSAQTHLSYLSLISQQTHTSNLSCQQSCQCSPPCSARRHRLIETGIPSRIPSFPTEIIDSDPPTPDSTASRHLHSVHGIHGSPRAEAPSSASRVPLSVSPTFLRSLLPASF